LVYRNKPFEAENLKKERQLGVEEHSRQAAEAAKAKPIVTNTQTYLLPRHNESTPTTREIRPATHERRK